MLAEKLKAAIQELTALQSHAEELDKLEEKKSVVEADLRSSATQLADMKEQLSRASSGLLRSQEEAQNKSDALIHQKSIELRDVTRRTEEAKKELQTVETELASRRSLHDQILDSIESLRKRIS